MSDKTHQSLDAFWALIDEMPNAMPFVMIGLEILFPAYTRELFFAGRLAIPAILSSRFVSVALPVNVIRHARELTRGTVRIMTWGGLSGGLRGPCVVPHRRLRARDRAGCNLRDRHLFHPRPRSGPEVSSAPYCEAMKQQMAWQLSK
jgi:hypothetical protein